MKREHKCKPNPRLIYPWFIRRQCVKCKMDFVREYGWEFYVYDLLGYCYSKYLCKDCAQTQKEAYSIFCPPRGNPPSGGSSVK